MKYAADALTKKVKRQIIKAIRKTAMMDEHGVAYKCPFCLLKNRLSLSCDWCCQNIISALGSPRSCHDYKPGKAFQTLDMLDWDKTAYNHPRWFAAKQKHLLRRASALEKQWGLV